MEAITELFQINFVQAFMDLFGILIGILAVLSVLEKITDKFGIEFRWQKKKQQEHELLMATITEVSELRKKQEQDVAVLTENQIQNSEQSFKIQKEWRESQELIFESISQLTAKIDAMQKNTDERFITNERKQNKRIRAELKDKISDSYRRYHSSGKINDMEFEALEDLIEAYELADGENSFVHGVVQKEMYTWERMESDLQ